MKTVLRSSLAAAMVAGFLTATPAIAQDAEMTVSSTIEYNDLDLSTQEGQETLHARLRLAARYVCGMDIEVPGSRLPSTQARVCYREKLESFERQIAAAASEQDTAFGG